MRRGEMVLACKAYGSGIDIVEVFDEPPPGLVQRLPEREVDLRQVNMLAARCVASSPPHVLTVLHATWCALRKDVDPTALDSSLLMWDVV